MSAASEQPSSRPAKRQRKEGMPQQGSTEVKGQQNQEVSPERAAILASFDSYRAEIDQHNDRRERLIKASRDVTSLSKKAIFHCHRFDTSSPSSSKNARLLGEASTKLEEIRAIVKETANAEALGELEGELGSIDRSEGEGEEGKRTGALRAERYERTLGGGLEEYIEAASFLHFLQHGTLISLAEVQAQFTDETGKIFLPVSTHRYLLGLSDLTGELMRYATNAVGAGDAGTVVKGVLSLLRDLRAELEPFIPHVRDMRKKQQVTDTSVRKIEDVSYAITVRSSEYGSDPAALAEMVRRSLAGGGGDVGRPDEDD